MQMNQSNRIAEEFENSLVKYFGVESGGTVCQIAMLATKYLNFVPDNFLLINLGATESNLGRHWTNNIVTFKVGENNIGLQTFGNPLHSINGSHETAYTIRVTAVSIYFEDGSRPLLPEKEYCLFIFCGTYNLVIPKNE